MIAGTLWLILVNTGLFLIGVLVWRKIWVSRFGVKIPGYADRFYSVSSVLPILKKLLWELESEYWIEHTGIDGYIYLLFQRYLLKLLFIYTLIAVLASIPMNFTSSNNENFFTRTTLPRNMSVYASWFQVAITYIFSLGVLLTMWMLRKRVGDMLEEKNLMRSREQEHEWLMLRTAQVRGLDVFDRSGEALTSHFNNFLSNKGGKVVEVTLIPNFQKLLKLEIERENAILMKNLYSNSSINTSSFPSSAFNKEHYILRLEEIEKEIQEATMKPYSNSGHAVVVFNSIETLEKILYQYRQSLKRTCNLCFTNLKEKWLNYKRERAFSNTFQRFADDKMTGHNNLVVTRGMNPYDFIWQNFGGTRGFYFFRRLGLLILSVLILLFLSTPAALLAALESAVSDVSWAESLPGPLASVAQAYLPSIFIVMLNQLLLLLIDISAYMEKYYSHTEVQSSILHKAVVYLTLNMLVIPGLTIAAAKSFVTILSDREFLLADMLGELHVGEFGTFIVNVLLQKATFTSMFYLLRGSELSMNYFNVWLSFYIRS
jgi:Late exocytosis, associated with Golgi transport/Calcium-dependent channel, 7TM region, putative phosphate